MTKQKRAGKRQVPVGVGILIALCILGLYLLQVAGVLDLGLFGESTPTPAAVSGGDSIQVHFTTPKYPDTEADHHGGIDEILAADIAQARSSVDVAAYEFDLETVAQALIDAHKRGVQVRMVTDSDNVAEPAVRKLDGAGIPIVEDHRGAIMHDKFVIIDREIVWTGSWNLSVNCTYRNNNNAARIVSARLAENYRAEFEEMFTDKAFGPGSPSNTPHPQLTVDNIPMENYFAPEDHVADKIVTLLKGAKRSIRFMAFSFTDDRIGKVVRDKAKAGLIVQGVFEARGSDTEYSEYGQMRRAGLDVLTDGNPYTMHHKVFILDDETVLMGSFNFTQSADESNDENLLVIHDPAIAALYQAEFERVYAQADAAQTLLSK
jgi:phosphatidylserine/phosphatidylglycerophosphate/cardiolipin synthase-like enzyme